MEEDLLTQQHAIILAREYNFAPYDELKTERCLNPGTDLQSVWLAKKDRSARCFIQYHSDLLRGELCACCWGEDKIFGEDPTPKLVNIRFTNILACPGFGPAPNFHFTLTQDPENPCLFSVQVEDWLNSETLIITWDACDVDISTLLAYLDPSGSKYFEKSRLICEVLFENNLTVCDAPTTVGTNGEGFIAF